MTQGDDQTDKSHVTIFEEKGFGKSIYLTYYQETYRPFQNPET